MGSSGARLETWQRRIVWANFLGLTFEAYDLTIYSLLVVPVTHYFHVPVWYGFVVLSATFVVRGLGGLAFGHLADKLGRRNATIMAVIGYSVATAMTGLSWSVGSLLVWRLLTGAFVGAEYIGYSYTMEIVPKSRRGVFSGLIAVTFGVGFLLASATFSIVTALGGNFAADGWRWPFFIGILPALLALWMRLGVTESPIWAEQTRIVKRTPLLEVFTRPYLARTIRNWILLSALVWGYTVVTFAYPTMLTFMKFPRSQVGTLAILLNVGAIVGGLIGGHVSQVLGRRRALIVGAVLAIVAAPFVAPFWMQHSSPSYAYSAVFGFLFGMFGEVCYGVMPAYLSEQFPTEIRATGSAGTFNLAQIIGGWATLVLSARFAGSVGNAGPFATGMALMSMIAFVIMIVLVSFGPETRDVDLRELVAASSTTRA